MSTEVVMTAGRTDPPNGPAGSELVLDVSELRKSYGQGGEQVKVLDGVSFKVHASEFVCMVGPSGCGKSTLLNCVSGLLAPTGGSIYFEGQLVNEPPEKMAVVFQDYSRSLLPWMTVAKNVELPMRKKFERRERAQRIEQVLDSVGLANKGHLYPWQMSGGMQQRAAIARGLAYRPDVLLMDEPFAAVDAQTRVELEDLVLSVREQYNTTIVFVTHDIDEAVYLADRVIVLSGAPTSVTEDLQVSLARPRHQIETKLDPAYAKLRAHVFQLIQAAKSNVG
jgi:NitT/TauT family transport system ATP-binding protein